MERENEIELEMHKYVDSAFKSGILKFVILNAISRQSTYPYDLYKKLSKIRFGILQGVRKSEVYNTLNSLEAKGFVKGETQLFGSKVKKRYKITNNGMRVVLKSRKVMMRNISNIKKLISYEFE
jgi:DNA-binding PadR family transcriptional regulator